MKRKPERACVGCLRVVTGKPHKKLSGKFEAYGKKQRRALCAACEFAAIDEAATEQGVSPAAVAAGLLLRARAAR
jgi:hypothetical protein